MKDIPWICCWAIDPPPTPHGYELEMEFESFTGYAIYYRFVPTFDTLARLAVEGGA